MLRTIVALGCGVLLLSIVPTAASQVDGTDPAPAPVSRVEARDRALAAHAGLAALRHRRQAAQATTEQAARGPNPELVLEFENFAGSGAWHGLDATEITLAVSQTFELGGKRDRLQAAAAWDVVAVERDLLRATAEVATAVDAEFDQVLAAQAAVDLATELHALAAAGVDQIVRRAERGAASAAEVARARTVLATVELDLSQAHRGHRAALARLATWWELDQPAPTAVDGDLAPLPALPAWDDLVAALDASPELLQWDAAAGAAQAAADVAAAAGRIDLTASAGVRHDRASGDNAAVAAIAVPLPLRDRNQDGIRAASARLAGVEASGRARRTELTRELLAAHSRLAATRERVIALREHILPLAAETLTATEDAYRQGRHRLTEVLAARGEWARDRAALTDALLAGRQARRDIDLLLGTVAAAPSPAPEDN